ncbi:MAG TPA: amino acid permease [Polyangiaceae bacterium]|jgi:amino acid transporter|nr:amino acid permease [Polyangiaceae bacterium]
MTSRAPTDLRPSRAIGLFSLTALTVNGILGSGIFMLPTAVARILGPAGPIAYGAAAFAIALIVLCFAEASTHFEESGGPYLYARAAFGPFVGFQAGWLFIATRLVSVAAIANGTASYLGTLWEPFGTGAGRPATAVGVIASLAALNLIGIRQGKWTVNVLTIAKLLPLVLFIAAGLPAVDGSRIAFAGAPQGGSVREGAFLLVFTFAGFEAAAIAGHEIVNPRKNLPIAMLAAVGLTTAVYVGVQIVAQGTLPGLATSPAPIAEAARTFLGPSGATIIGAGAVLATLGTNGTNLLVTPRMIYALADGGHLPPFLARIHPRFRTPHIAIAVFAVAASGIALVNDFTALAATSVVSRLCFFATTCLAVPVMRRRCPAPVGRFRIPGGPLVPAAATALCVWLISASTPAQRMACGGAIVAGTMLYAWSIRRFRAEATALPKELHARIEATHRDRRR